MSAHFLTNDEVYYPLFIFTLHHPPAPSSALQLNWTLNVYGYCLAGSVWYKVSLIVIDCKLGRLIANQSSLALVIVWLFHCCLHSTTIVYLYRTISHVDIPSFCNNTSRSNQTFQLLYCRELCSLPVVFTFYTSCTSLGSHCHWWGLL